MAFRRGSGRGAGYNPMAAMPPIRRSAFSTAAAATPAPDAPPSTSGGIGSLVGGSFHSSPPAYHQPHQQAPSIGSAVPSLMHLSCRQPQQQFYGYNSPSPAAWHGLLPTSAVPQQQPQYPIGWPAAPPAIGSSGASGLFSQQRRGGYPQPLLFAGRGGISKPAHARMKQQQQLQQAASLIVPLMAGVKPDRGKKRRQQQPMGDQQVPSSGRPVVEIITDVQQALRETCANVDRREMPLQAVVFAVRERVPDFHFHYVFALARDLDVEALHTYYGDIVGMTTKSGAEGEDSITDSTKLKTEPQIDEYTVLCDLYACGVFSGVQGRGCNQLAARLDACRRFVDTLVDAANPPRLADIRRAWQRGSIVVQSVATFPEPPAAAPTAEAAAEAEAESSVDAEMPADAAAEPAAEPKPTEMCHPPLLSMFVGPSSRHRFEVRARGVSQCLVKLIGNAPVSTVNLSAWEPEPVPPPSLLGEIGSGGGVISPVLSPDPWASTASLSTHLDSLFVCHPAAHVVKVLPPIAQFRLTCHFNGLMKVTSSSIGPTVAEGRERPCVTAQLHLGNQLLGQAEGDTLESAKTAAALAFIDAASQLQPVIRVHRTCPPGLLVVARDALVSKGRELFEADPDKYRRSMQRLFQQAGSGASPIMSRTFWHHLVAKQPSLEDFLLQCLAYVEEFHSEPLECRVLGSDLEFPEMCALYCCFMCSGFDFQVDAVLEDYYSPCHQRLLVHKQLDTVDVKRRVLTDGSFARLELVSLGSRIDHVKAALGLAAT